MRRGRAPAISIWYGGRGEIRTHETLAGLPVFKTGALNHSATLPISALSTPSLSANPQRNRRLRHGVTASRELRMCVGSRKNATFPRRRLILLEIGSVLSQQTAPRGALV